MWLLQCEEESNLSTQYHRYTIKMTIVLLILASTMLLLVLPNENDCLSLDDPMMNRRSIFSSSSAATAVTVVAASGGAMTGWLIPASDAEASIQQQNLSSDRNKDSLLAYQVIPDASPKKNPTIKSVTVS